MKVPPRDVPGTILYIDDTPSNLLLVGRLLERRPMVTLLTAVSGEEGVAIARSRRPDLVLLDFHLTDMTGEEVIVRLGHDVSTRAIPVVLLTADSGRTPGVHMIAGRSVECLSKPIDTRRFVAVIDEQLGRRNVSA
jgi:response regulator RpfG family c-di-GMP phosphodiesterase